MGDTMQTVDRYLPDTAHARRVIDEPGPIYVKVSKAWLELLLDQLDEARAHCRERGLRISKLDHLQEHRKADIARLHAEKVELRDVLMQVATRPFSDDPHADRDVITWVTRWLQEHSRDSWEEVLEKWTRRYAARMQISLANQEPTVP